MIKLFFFFWKKVNLFWWKGFMCVNCELWFWGVEGERIPWRLVDDQRPPKNVDNEEVDEEDQDEDEDEEYEEDEENKEDENEKEIMTYSPLIK